MSKLRRTLWSELAASLRYPIAVLSVAIAIAGAEILTRLLHTEPIASSLLCAAIFAAMPSPLASMSGALPETSIRFSFVCRYGAGFHRHRITAFGISFDVTHNDQHVIESQDAHRLGCSTSFLGRAVARSPWPPTGFARASTEAFRGMQRIAFLSYFAAGASALSISILDVRVR